MITPAKSSRTVGTLRLRMRVVHTNGTGDCKILLKMTRRLLQLFTGGLRTKYAYTVVKPIAIV